MRDSPFGGKGILVTRPREQSAELTHAIERRGGIAVAYPVIEIVPTDSSVIAAAAAKLPRPDLAIFVSRNAAALGAQFVEAKKVAAIGTATASALAANDLYVDIVPNDGFDSESLLQERGLENVADQQIWIVRGSSGRELLADTLRARGATVHYLSVYCRQLPIVDTIEQEVVESLWLSGAIDVVTVMSVESLDNLIKLLPRRCSSDLARLPLVTPAARVIKELLHRYPSAQPVLAADPSADAMLDAIRSALQMDLTRK